MEDFETLKLEYTWDNPCVTLDISENFSTETLIFSQLAEFIGSDHHYTKKYPYTHLTTLEKLEILCKKAREHIFEQSAYDEVYTEVRVFTRNEQVTFGAETLDAKLYDEVIFISNNFFKVRNDLKYGLLTFTLEEVLPIEQDDIFILSDDYFCCRREGFSYIYTTEGIEVMGGLDGVTENCNPFGVGPDYFWIKKDGKWGLLDHHLKFLIPCRLEYDRCDLITNFEGTLFYIRVEKDEKVGMINGLLNMEIIPLDEEIEDIMYTHKQVYLISKKGDLPAATLSLKEVDKIEREIRDQN